MRRVYLDHAATTPARPEVLETMMRCYREVVGNASSLHMFGQEAKRALEGARKSVARILGADPGEIYFTGGGTESDNLAVKGVVRANEDRGGHVITSSIEHHAVLHSCQQLEEEGYEVTYLPVDRHGLVDLDALASSIREDTMLVSVMLANNEVGTVQPLAEISAMAEEYDIPVHTDAVQAIGKRHVDVDALGVDLLSLAAHKFYGPKGVGVLYVRQGTRVAPLLHGGHQERTLYPGTEDIPGVVGLETALALAHEEIDDASECLAGLRDRLQRGIEERIPDVALNGHPTSRLPNILNMSFAGVEGESLLMALDTQGIAVSTGSACTAGSSEPSHVLRAMGLDRNRAQGSLRFSLGRDNDAEDIAYVVNTLTEVVERLRELSPTYVSGRRI